MAFPRVFLSVADIDADASSPQDSQRNWVTPEPFSITEVYDEAKLYDRDHPNATKKQRDRHFRYWRYKKVPVSEELKR